MLLVESSESSEGEQQGFKPTLTHDLVIKVGRNCEAAEMHPEHSAERLSHC